MTEHVKLILFAQIAIAILILPSSASVVCNCSGEDPCGDHFSSPCEALTWCEYCTSSGKDDVYDLDGYVEDETVGEDSLGPSQFPPVAYDSNVTVTGDTPVEISLNATDPDGNSLTYLITSGPSYGILANITGDTVVYTAGANYTSGDSFSFRANDGAWDSNTATVTIIAEPISYPLSSHAFYGTVIIDGKPAPGYTMISASGPGVRTNLTGNPLVTRADGSYGSADDTAQDLVVTGCIEDGAPLSFSVDGVSAGVSDANTSGPWQPTYPFQAGGVTNLTIRVPPPPPAEVSIFALSMTITNSTYGFYKSIKLNGDPWMEAQVTPNVFTIHISASGANMFTFLPDLLRDTTLGIYENGRPVSSEKRVRFGTKVVDYEYIANETRTFDILMYVNERPEIRDVKHITISVFEPDRYNITATAGPGGSIPPAPAQTALSSPYFRTAHLSPITFKPSIEEVTP